MKIKKLASVLVRLVVLASMVFGSVSISTPVKAAALTVESASPIGAGAPRSSQIQITFSDPINPATFSGTLSGVAFVPTQVVFDAQNKIVTIDPGELEYGRTYPVVINGSVQAVDQTQMGTDYTFSFSVIANPTNKAPVTTVQVPTGIQAGNTVTLSGTASGYIWQRDANNPLSLQHWDANGNITGDSPMLHPSALYFPQGMDGYKFWLFYTPYPSETDENPVLMRSKDGVNFEVSEDIHNPLIKYNTQPPYDTQNLADPEAYRVGNTWMLFYEQEALGQDVLPYMGSGGNIGVALSADGKNWTPYGGAYNYDPDNKPIDFPTNGNPVVKPPTSTSTGYRSGEMAIIFKDGLYHMWRTVIDGGLYIDHDTATDPRGPWTLQPDKLEMGGYEYGPHPDVVYDAERNLYLLLYLIPSGPNMGQLGLYTSSSPSGPWNLHPINPIFSASPASPWEGTTLYHSSMVNVDGQWYMYYSGNTTGSPHIGLAREVPGVRRVEISTNGGTTWQAAAVNLNGTWTYQWTPSQPGAYTVQARVVDDFMQGIPSIGVSVPVSAGPLPAAQAPILVIKDSSVVSNPFSGYLTEILKAEGITEFQQIELGTLMADADPLTFLSHFSVVLLGQSTINSVAKQVLQNYVTSGGNLIAMRPDPTLADLFGLTYVNVRPEQLLQFYAIDPNSEAGSGIVHSSLQYHGEADNYTLTGATALATLWNSISTPSLNPAVTLRNFGSGSAIAYTFDLAKSIVMTRQGNPAWKDTEGDTLGGYRPMDMFARPNGDWWLSPDRTRVPQADEEQRFLANLILTLSNKPLPRIWYLPGEHHSVFISTGDAEGVGGPSLEHVMNDIVGYGGRYTNYLMEAGIAATDPAVEAAWRAAGMEVGPHVYGGGPDTCAALSPAYAQIAVDILSKFGHVARTARSHTIDWCGWSDMAEIEANNGTGLDTNYYHYNNLLLPYGENANGYFTGSGLPQRFVNEQGTVLPIYQAATQFPDEWFADNGKSAAEVTQIIEDIITAAENGNYSAFVANIHHVRYDGADSITHTWANTIWAYAQSHNIPLWSAEMLLDFVKARDASRFDNLTFINSELNFDFVPGDSRQDLTVMIPANHLGNNLLSVNLNGSSQAVHSVTVKGLEYAQFTSTSTGGHVTATYGQDTTSPVISDVQANSIGDVAARITWQTDELATSQVEYGTNPASLNQSRTVPGSVTSHVVPLSGLNPMTQYHFRVTSIDRTGNPASVSSVYSFTTGMPRWVETTTADFLDGLAINTAVTNVSDGEIILGVGNGGGDEFEGSALNTTTWYARNLFGGDPVVSVSSGQVTVSSGTYIRTNQTYFQKSLEAMVTLRSGQNAHFGWADTVNSGDDGIVDPHWIMFTLANGVFSARTRVNDGQGVNGEVNTPLTGIAPDVPHLLKLVWGIDNSVQFWVDGVLKTEHTRNFTQPFRVYITSNAGQNTSADWVRILGNYSPNGSYESSVFDAGQNAEFTNLSWTGETPAETGVTFETRTSVDGLVWDQWLATLGETIASLPGQFLQYRAVLSTTNFTFTPRIDDVVVSYQPAGTDTTPPLVTSVTPPDRTNGVSIATNITVNFNEPIDPDTFQSTINGTNDFSITYQNGNRVAILDPNVNFDLDSQVTVIVSGTVTDRAGNSLGSPYSWSFFTSAQSLGWVETSVADFLDGTADKVLITNSGDGELCLTPDLDDHFTGSNLDTAWVSGLWAGGAYSPTVSNSEITLGTPGSFVHSMKTFGPGLTIEGRIRFDNGGNLVAPYMYFGLSGPSLTPWAFFGTGYTGDQVYITTYNFRTGDPVTVGLGNLFGAWHNYKITWNTNQVEYFVDGVLRHTEPVSISGPLSIFMSLSNSPSGASIAADWIQVNQYSSIQQSTREFSDNFSGTVLNWESLGNPQFDGPAGADYHLDTVNGKLVHGILGTSYHPAVPANFGELRNFEFEVDAESDNGFWAVAWGIQDNAHYYFAQSYSGTLAVFRVNSWTIDGSSFSQLGSFPAPAIYTGISQRIRLVGQNGVYTIFVDGNQIGSVQDATYPSGRVGVVGYGGWINSFDNVLLQGPESIVIPGGSGTYTSNIHDFGGIQVWNGLSWIGQNPANTSVAFLTRSSPDQSTWSDWTAVNSGGNITSPANRYLQYRVQLGSTDLNSSPIVEQVAISTSTQPKIDLSLTKVGANFVAPGDTLHYTMQVTNQRALEATGVTLVDTLPAEVVFDSASQGCAYASQSHDVSCDLGTIDGFAAKSIIVDVHISITATGTIQNSALVKANESEANNQDNTAVKQTQINYMPVAVADSYSINQDTVLTIGLPGVLANDTDQDGQLLTAVKVTGPSHGTITLNGAGSFIYIPAPGFFGSDSFTYKANDGFQDSIPANVSIQVNNAGTPVLPSSFYGEIHFSENPPNPGDIIQIRVLDTIVTTTTVQPGSPLFYNIDVPGDNPSTIQIEGGVQGGQVTFILNGQTMANALWGTGTHTRIDLNSFAIHLQPGWNLVSFNLHPLDTSTAAVLTSIAGNYNMVYAWDATGDHHSGGNWMSYDPLSGYPDQSLTELTEKMGFWIHMTASGTLVVTGSIPASTNIALDTLAGGWNLVGFPSGSHKSLPDALSIHGVGTNFSLIYGYDAAAPDVWKLYDRVAPGWVNDLTELTPGWGYWIKNTTSVNWNVTYP